MSTTLSDQILELKNAIGALEAQRAVLGDSVVEASISALQSQLSDLESRSTQPPQHRKQASLLFADIASSTRLTWGLDPEEEMEIIDQGVMRIAAPVEAHGGHIARYQGDGFKAVFGVPTAREGDPEMAVRAGLAIVDAARAYGREIEARHQMRGFNVRVGIDTGLVVTGGVSEGEDTIKGTPVNLAARLEGYAPAGGVLISEQTYQQVRGIFEVEEQAPLVVKGFAKPVRNWLVVGMRARSFVNPSRGMPGVRTRMVGRSEQLGRLKELLRKVVQEKSGQMVTVLGEAGVGKSRLVFELENWIGSRTDSKYHIFRGRCRAENSQRPYTLFADLFAMQFQIQDSDPADVLYQKMEAGIAALQGDAEEGRMRSHFIAQLCGFDFSQSPFLRGIHSDTRQIRDRSRRYLVEYFQAAARQRPVLLLLDDLHWADANSLDAVLQIAGSLGSHPLLTVCIARPDLLESHSQWGQHLRYHTRLELEPLSRPDSRELVSEIMQQYAQVPLVLRELVISSSEGNPFFIEELLKMLEEDQVILHKDGQLQVDQDRLLNLEVPATLTSVLQARLDSLPALERMILQQASVVGRVFWEDILLRINLSAVEEAANEEIKGALNELHRKEMIFAQPVSAFSGSREFSFKHSLLRDVTYESVLKRSRQNYHGLVADWLIAKSGDRSQEFTAQIGEHLDYAGRSGQATGYIFAAGVQAAKRYANLDALRYLGRALELTGGQDPERSFDILAAREQVYNLLGERDSQAEDLAALAGLAEQLDQPERRGQVARLQAIHARAVSDYAGIIIYAGQTIAMGQEAGNAELIAEGELLWGLAHISQGNYAEAQERFQRSLASAAENGLLQIEADSRRNLGILSQRIGQQDLAIEHLQSALSIFRQLGDRRGEGRTFNQLGNIFLVNGDRDSAQSCYDSYRTISQEIGDLWGQGIVVQVMGDISLGEANPSAASRHFQDALQTSRRVKNRTMEQEALLGLGQASLEKSEFSQSLDYFQRSLGLARSIGNRPMEGKALNETGRFFGRLGDFVRARSYFEQALELFEEMGSRASQARSLVNLSELDNLLEAHDAAERNVRRAIDILADAPHREIEGLARIQLGQALAGQQKWRQAQSAYQESIELLEAVGQRGQVSIAQAGLGWSLLHCGQKSAALEAISELLPALGRNGERTGRQEGHSHPEESRFSMEVYWRCYQVLLASEDRRAADMLDTARAVLEERAAKIEDIELRLTFLDNIPAHRAIQSS